MKLHYICNECGLEITSSGYEEQSSRVCYECGGHFVKNTAKFWSFSDKNGQSKGPFYEEDLRKAFTKMEINERTEITNLLSSERKPLSQWESLKSVMQSDTPAEEPNTPVKYTTINTLLIPCESCGHQFSKRAKECPKCGWRPQAICQICNRKIPYDSTSCPECGDPKPFEKTDIDLSKEKTKYFANKVQSNTSKKEQTARKASGEVKMKQVIRWLILIIAFVFATLVYGISKELIPPSGLVGAIRGVLIFSFLYAVWNLTKKIGSKKGS